MTKITFLGTSSMQPTKERNHPSILLTYKSENILFDCGEGTQRQMRIGGIKPSKITKICISHWHGDHVLGLPGLMSTMGTDQYAKKVEIYGPKGTKKYIEHMLKAFFSKDVIDFEINEVNEGIIFENKEFRLEAAKLEHGTTCIGFSFTEKDKLRINMAKAKRLGLNEGPELGKLQEGKDIQFNNQKINHKDVTYKVYGKKFSYISDTINCDGANKLAEDSDLLVSECSFHSNEENKAEEYLHLTAKDAALIASQHGVKKLILTHPSLRYKDVNVLVEEAKNYFQETIFAHDFMKVNL
ncbi:ribonuclease Z [archaeon]|jgi:ribonuclease Z|nr:ribonuclease Z [archaeon]MBT3450972.1 ribonuclease Z [archaeon]MBT6868608.1 ribonuclease Z [archaeon]MBT7193140.1 ribonuclease Z [archaeon]MBT7381120.1 ribonuclease Z [archaeon]